MNTYPLKWGDIIKINSRNIKCKIECEIQKYFGDEEDLNSETYKVKFIPINKNEMEKYACETCYWSDVKKEIEMLNNIKNL